MVRDRKLPSAVLAIDAGGTFFKSALVNAQGEVISGTEGKRRVDSEGEKEGILAAYEEIVKQAQADSKLMGISLCGIGVSTPGPFDYQNGVSLMKHKMQSIYGVSLKDEIARRCPGTDQPIRFVHDANAFLLGEVWKGSGAGFKNVAGITIGTGTGFAVVLDGKLMTNPSGGPYYSIYKLPLGDGILEDSISRRGINALYRKLSGRTDDGFDVVDIERYAKNGDSDALDTFARTGRILAENVSSILRELEIECLVLGGQIAKGYFLMKEEVEKGLCGVPSLKKVCRAADIGGSPLIGAAFELLQTCEKCTK